jgi:hypothetical protein
MSPPPDVASLQDIAAAWLPIMELFKPDPTKAPLTHVVRLASLAEMVERHGKTDLGKKLTTLMLATMPVPELPLPTGGEMVAAWLVDSIETELRSWLV